MTEVARGIALGEATENFGAVKSGGLGQDARAQQSENEGEEGSARFHVDVIDYNGQQYRMQ